jgi:hypothetical protein
MVGRTGRRSGSEKGWISIGGETPGKLEKLLQRKIRFSLPPIHNQERRPREIGISLMQERADEPKVGDEVLLKGAKHRIRGIIYEEDSVILARLADDEVTHLLWHPTWEWDDGEQLWRATNYRLLEKIE